MKSKFTNEYVEVYSTDTGRVCANCGCPKGACSCAEKRKSVVKGDGTVRVRRETKGRGGKTVTTISGLPLNNEKLKALASELKRMCGGGGSVKDGVIEIQGDHCDTLVKEMQTRGYQAKRAGG